ncbi:hypothetical protein BJV77DRAFT_1020933 [Russula vinacea]|nr:hypothetical protein BJV77DRAFT_1020933 [Russula vinacea]
MYTGQVPAFRNSENHAYSKPLNSHDLASRLSKLQCTRFPQPQPQRERGRVHQASCLARHGQSIIIG